MFNVRNVQWTHLITAALQLQTTPTDFCISTQIPRLDSVSVSCVSGNPVAKINGLHELLASPWSISGKKILFNKINSYRIPMA